MRASATSKTSPAANYAAVQAKSNTANAAKADEASPFALLVGSVAPSGRDASRPPVKDVSNSSDKGADSKPAKADDDRAPQTASANSSAKPEKTGKAADKDEPKARGERADDDKTVKADKAENDKDRDLQVAANQSPTQNPQAPQQALAADLPSPPPVAQMAAPADDQSDDLAVDAAAPAAPKPQSDIKPSTTGKADAKPGTKADAKTPATAPVKPDATTATDAPALADDSDDDTDTQIAEPASQTAAAASDRRAIVENSGAKNPDASSQTPSDTQTATAAGDRRAIVQNSGAKNPTAPSPDEAAPKDIAAQDATAKTDSTAAVADNPGKGSGIKTTAPKSRAAQTDVTDKADIAKTDAPKSDATQTATPQADISPVATAPKAAPHPASQAIFAINSIAAPQAAQSPPVAAATANAHVQVSAEATPDLPSLAVAIAGKSQSGAKQFDIRLDPPELGRVEVRLSIDATGKASAHLSADQPQTLSLLQKDAPVLTRALREAGLDVAQDGLNFSLRQQNENQSGNTGNNGRRGSSRAFTASISIDAAAGTTAYRAAANGRLDIRV